MRDTGVISGRRRWQAGAAVALTLAAAAGLVWPAILNGYPLLYNDSAVFINNSGSGRFHAARAVGYPLFLRVTTLEWSLWLAVFTQALLTAVLLARVAWLFARNRQIQTVAGAFAVLLILTGAAKYASWIMADVFTGWLLLAPALWFLARGVTDRVAAGLALVLAVIVHNSHLPVALAGVGLALSVAALAWRGGLPGGGATLRNAALLCMVTLVAIPVSWGLNTRLAGRSSVLNGTHALLLNRFVGSGVAARTLDRYCGEKDWFLCDDPEIRTAGITYQDWFLYHPKSPFRKMSYTHPEFEDVVQHAFRCCFGRIVWTTASGAAAQFMEIDSQNGLLAVNARASVRLIRALMPRDFPGAEASGQVNGRPVRVRALPLPEQPLHAAFLLAAIVLGAAAFRRQDWRAMALLGGTVGFLALNASVTAFGSTLHARYQGRVAWLLPYAVVLVASQRRERPLAEQKNGTGGGPSGP